MADIAAGAARGKRVEIWFQDEARIGQKNKITRRWAKRGTRPTAPHDQRTRSAYIFGAICPKLGKAAALVMPWCDTHAMTQHLSEISRHIADDAHAIPVQSGRCNIGSRTPKMKRTTGCVAVLGLGPR
ncbi:transposase [Rhizobium skierniewicense]|uniref:transposase n=1 Tax=Rhizobium skierniewicense TaxID=984260 RepID=UPI00161A7236